MPSILKYVSFCKLNMGNDKPEDIGPLPLSMVSSKRTGEEGTENTTHTAGYAYTHITCYITRYE